MSVRFSFLLVCRVQMSRWLLEEKAHVTMEQQLRIVCECRERLEVEAAGFRLDLSRVASVSVWPNYRLLLVALVCPALFCQAQVASLSSQLVARTQHISEVVAAGPASVVTNPFSFILKGSSSAPKLKAD